MTSLCVILTHPPSIGASTCACLRESVTVPTCEWRGGGKGERVREGGRGGEGGGGGECNCDINFLHSSVTTFLMCLLIYWRLRMLLFAISVAILTHNVHLIIMLIDKP